ncbi:DUF6777 domain-containing protein [Pseudonocardia aurantiaca]|uniref:non-specific serine/threonine protein kinase n=1 Tax=Pseudonocardia aurantiaca TaxID=75290 RepID=A0ABW4FVC7_9PSEU
MPEEMFGQYRLERLLGRGGMGEVYQAFDTVRHRAVAIKRLPPILAADPGFEARFRVESALVARLREPHIIPIHDFGEIDGWLFIDMRLVEGPDLARLLNETGPVEPERAVHLVAQIAAALDVAHAEDLMHRDIKPGNVLVTLGGDGDEFVYVADFGLARAISATSTSLTATGSMVGSMEYMAPERFTDGNGDHRVDVYSLGCLLYEALTGQKPFPVEGLPAVVYAHLHTPPPRPSDLVPGLPLGLDDVVAHAMAKNPKDRYPTAGALASAARAALDGARETITVPVHAAASTVVPGAVTDPVRPPAARGRRRWRGLLVAVVLLAVVATLVSVGFLQGNEEAAGGDVVAEPGGRLGRNPFMPPVGVDKPAVAAPPRSGGTLVGDTPGLYGGTRNIASCDAGAMATFLNQHPDRKVAWAGVQGITMEQVPSYVEGLTPALLRSDTSVTNHGFVDGRATVVPTVLQTGTAVLVDDHGVPRVRCSCGNPLTSPARIEQPRYVGSTWPGLSPATTMTIAPGVTPIREFTLVDPVSREVFIRPVGTDGDLDRPANSPPPPPPPSATPPAPPSTVASTPRQRSSPRPQPQPQAQPQPQRQPSAAPSPSVAPPPDPTTETVKPSPPEPRVIEPLADLIPTSIRYDESQLVRGSPVIFDSGIRNTGDAGTDAFTIKWFVNGQEVGANGSHSGIPAGTTVGDGDSQFRWTFDPGAYRITFAVDTDDVIHESNEGNNSTSVAITIS